MALIIKKKPLKIQLHTELLVPLRLRNYSLVQVELPICMEIAIVILENKLNRLLIFIVRKFPHHLETASPHKP